MQQTNVIYAGLLHYNSANYLIPPTMFPGTTH